MRSEVKIVAFHYKRKTLALSFARTSAEASGGNAGQIGGLGQGSMLRAALQTKKYSFSRQILKAKYLLNADGVTRSGIGAQDRPVYWTFLDFMSISNQISQPHKLQSRQRNMLKDFLESNTINTTE